jgi:hypothetical protein
MVQLATARIVAGMGIGVIMAAMKPTVAASRNPVRIFGLQGIYFLAIGIVGFPIMAPVIKVWSISGVYVAMALMVTLIFRSGSFQGNNEKQKRP